MDDIDNYKLFPSQNYVSSLIMKYAYDGNLNMVNKLIDKDLHQYHHPPNPEHLIFKAICYRNMHYYSELWEFFRLNKISIPDEGLGIIKKVAIEQGRGDVSQACSEIISYREQSKSLLEANITEIKMEPIMESLKKLFREKKLSHYLCINKII